MSKDYPTARSAPKRLKIAITGASGFLGRVMARESEERGHEVLRLSRRAADAVVAVDWDQSPEILAGQLRGFAPDCVIHCAGSASVAASLEAPHLDLQASVGTWTHLLEALRFSGVNPLVLFPSSAAVYGNPDKLPVDERAALQPISPYGRHKKIAESLAEEYRARFGLNVVVLRLFSVFGPTQKRLLVRELFEKHTGGPGAVEIGGSGQETRDFLSEWCVADAMLQLSSQPKTTGEWVFNLASGVERSIMEVACEMRTITQSGKEIICLQQARPGDPARWHADTQRIRLRLPGWSPLPFDVALQRTVADWMS